MENKSRGLLIIILCLLVLGLGGFIVYDKFVNPETIKNSDMDEIKFNYNLSKRTTAQAVRNENVEVVVDTEGKVYLHTIKNSENEKENTKTAIKTLEKQFKSYNPKGYEFVGETEFKAIKLDLDKVLTAYVVNRGNGGFVYFVFVTEEGKLAYVNYDKIVEDGKVDVKEIVDIKNIVSVVNNTNTMTPYAIDINGKEISLNDYIK